MDFNPNPALQLQAGIMLQNQTSSRLSPRGNSSCSYTQPIFNGRNDTNPPDECSCNMDAGSRRGRNFRKLDSLLGRDKTMISHNLALDPASKMSRCNADQKTNYSFDESAFRATASPSGQRDDKRSSTECSCNMDIIGGNKGRASTLRSEALSTGVPEQESCNLFDRASTSNVKDCKNLKRSKSGNWSSDAGNKRYKHTARKTYIINLITGTCDEIRDADQGAKTSNLGRGGEAKQHACSDIQTSFGTCSTKILRHSHHALNSFMQPMPMLNLSQDGVSSNIYKKNNRFTASRCSSSSSSSSCATAAAVNAPYKHCYGGWLPG